MAPSPLPTRIDSYRVTGFLGEGGMGIVYRGRHEVPAMAEAQGGDVALKLIRPELLIQQPRLKQRLEQEARIGLKLRHPNIVQVLDVRPFENSLVLVMELVPGRPLSDVLSSSTKALPEQFVFNTFLAVLDGVGYAHSQGVTHRDLKPANIFVSAGAPPKIFDFGIAKVADRRGMTVVAAGMGTVDYMPPEQHRDARKADARSDIYALGLTLYEMVAGRPPWPATTSVETVLMDKIGGNVPPLRQRLPSVHPAVDRVILKAISPEPDDRYQTTSEFAAALRYAIAPESAPTLIPGGRDARGTIKKGLLGAAIGGVGALLAFGVLAIVGIVLLLSDPGTSSPPAPAPVPVSEPAPPAAPAVCDDDALSGTGLEASEAWHGCRWGRARELYMAALPGELAPNAAICSQERLAAVLPHTETLTAVEAAVAEGRCHQGLAKLRSASFAPSARCQARLDSCEEEQRARILAEVQSSERYMEGQLVGNRHEISDVSFSRAHGTDWEWDISVHGPWTAWLVLMAAGSAMDDPETYWESVAAFILTCETVGAHSQTTEWKSRHLRFIDDGDCRERMTTRGARACARELRTARRFDTEEAMLGAVNFCDSRYLGCD
ncbi:MAG: serine/threonine protein kinase [Proteobacteria bacterium]|nr:serine/threonine protein kinase [Pseudomonadota bacterium]